MAVTVTITSYGIQKGTDNTCYIFWSFTKETQAKEYAIKWYYTAGGKTFIGEETTTTNKQATYGAPSNADKVLVTIKPVSKTYKSKGKKRTYFTGEWSTKKSILINKKTPEQPSAPNIELDGLNLIVSASTYDINASKLRFHIVKNDSSTVKVVEADVKTHFASVTVPVAAGARYKARVRGVNSAGDYGDYSEYTQNIYTRPGPPTDLIVDVRSDKTLYVHWTVSRPADSYTVEYTEDLRYFDSSSMVQSQESETTSAYIQGIEYGKTWYFRVRCNSEKSEDASEWSAPVKVTLGEKPAPPTTWSNSVSVRNDEEIIFYINHNSKDGSAVTKWVIDMTVNGEPYTGDLESYGRIYKAGSINTITRPEEDKYKTLVVKLVDNPLIREGAVILWKARTVGVTFELSDYSVERRIDVYSNPTVDILLSDTETLRDTDTITMMPLYIQSEYNAGNQKAIAYTVSVLSKEPYTIIDETGTDIHVSENQEVYSQYYSYDDSNGHIISTILGAGDLILMNNVEYSVNVTVVMDSGLTAENSHDFVVAWAEDESDYDIDAGISVDDKAPYGCYISPYANDLNGNLIDNVTLAVYRREYDGSLLEIASRIQNDGHMTVTDPHPALDYARYRIVVTSNRTGRNYSVDLPGEPVGVSSIVLQWDEDWHNYANDEPDALDEFEAIEGSLVELKYNIKTSESHNREISYGNYIGRKHPVSYYGTQLGETASWSSDIPKDDIETILKLRRLAVYQGNVYVRSPNGVGFWATVDVSFPLDYDSLSSTVSLTITRVEGGI